MAYRCPAAQVVGPVVLEGYELLFRGNASGNGVATIKPKEGQQVHGLLWRITPGCERSLDLYEGYPHLYEKESVAVRDNAGRQLTVMAYVMTDGDRWRSPALPSEYYYQGIRDGYRQNGLPLSKLKQAWEYVPSFDCRRKQPLPYYTSGRCRAGRSGAYHIEKTAGNPAACT